MFLNPILIVFCLLCFGIGAFLFLSPQLGGGHSSHRLERIRSSSHYRRGRFRNQESTALLGSLPNRLLAVLDFALTRNKRFPEKPIPVEPLDTRTLEAALPGSCRIFWLGHSCLLIQLDGKNIVTDPVLSRRASPLVVAGPKSFYDQGLVSPLKLPEIHIMVISHDHYDHLDIKAIRALDKKTRHYVVPLGLGSHLESWGVLPEKIHECDWEESVCIDGITLTATPSRHFSGRGPFDRFKTLWASFVIEGAGKRLFFGGDSGYDQGFMKIGESYGPFDLTFLECGAYSKYWPNIHMLPEQTVQAHQDLKGRALMPIHWARFNLSIHSWTEPVERLLAKAGQDNVRVVTPMIGQGFDLDGDMPDSAWW
ncbi:MAG: MBL fold metallo-hydrolase [Proteobacteria bacterium]|nr:MBL fold metallo-hydrolase [Pseudomonadota bacterium]